MSDTPKDIVHAPKKPAKKPAVRQPLPIILKSHLSPGDIVCMTAAVRDLHENYPGIYATDVRTSCGEIWENNHYTTKLKGDEVDIDAEKDVGNAYKAVTGAWSDGKIPSVKLEYPAIHQSNDGPSHFTEGYTNHLEQVLGVRIRKRLMRGHIELPKDERGWISQVQESTGNDTYYWIVVNGGKYDYTAKWWDPARMQRVVSELKEVTFVQVGQKEHHHIPLLGGNVIDLTGKTDLRQLIRLVYHSSGIICPVTLLMHLAAAVPVRKDKCYKRASRPCVVIAGGREPAAWEAYTGHAYLHTCGMLDCCDVGGCWKSRVLPLGDDDDKDGSLCLKPQMTENGNIIPACLKMIEVGDVVGSVRKYLP